MKLVDRYSQLLASVPEGAFYASSGQVLPFKGDLLHDLSISTGVPLTRFDVFINDTFVTSVLTDTAGSVDLHLRLVKGRNDIKLVNANPGTT